MSTNARERGWGDPPPPMTVVIPCAGDLPMRLRPEVSPLFSALIADVEAIKGKGFMTSSGGYNLRPQRGYELKWAQTKSDDLLSNHAWGLAADFRAGTNRMGGRHTDMPANMAELCERYGLRWGGTFAAPGSARYDPMHVEHVGTPAQAAASVAALTSTTTLLHGTIREDDLTAEDRELLTHIRDQNNWILGQLGFDAESGKWTGIDTMDGSKRKLSLLDMVRESHRELNLRITGRGPAVDTLLGQVLNIAKKLGADGR